MSSEAALKPIPIEGENGCSSDNLNKELKRRAALEAQLTAGCGYGRKKQELVDTFWNTVWLELEIAGWSKIEGSGRQAGSVLFFPPNVTKVSGKKGHDYYDRIRDVIDRVLKRRNEEESKVADAFIAERGEPGSKEQIAVSRPRRAAAQPPGRRASLPAGRGLVDLSWKDGGSTYPKRSSRLGDEYQATTLPSIGSSKSDWGEGSDFYCEQIWDPQEAEGKGANEFIKDVVPYNKKEQMLAELQGVGYLLESIDGTLSSVEPMDGSNWTEEDKEKFHAEIFRLRKDMKAVSQATNKSMKSCLAYYLGTFKKSDNYRLLKTICVEERREKTAAASVHGFDACAICGDGGSLLICDGCEGEYHMGCLRPPLKSVPEGNWECDECVDRKLLEARDIIIRYSTLYERVDCKRKRRGLDSQEEETVSQESDSKEIVFRPRSPVLKAMKTLASGITFSLCGTPMLSTKE